MTLSKQLVEALVQVVQEYGVTVVIAPDGYAASVRARIGSC